MAAVPAGLLTVPFIENINKFQNPFRRPVATAVFLIGTVVAIWLGIGATLPSFSLTLAFSNLWPIKEGKKGERIRGARIGRLQSIFLVDTLSIHLVRHRIRLRLGEAEPLRVEDGSAFTLPYH
jgi:hypothetical protein